MIDYNDVGKTVDAIIMCYNQEPRADGVTINS